MTTQPSIRRTLSRNVRRPLALAVALALSTPFAAHAAIPTAGVDHRAMAVNGAIANGSSAAAMAFSARLPPVEANSMLPAAMPVTLATPVPTALPSGFHPVSGGIGATAANNVLTVTQSTKGAIAEWTSFDIGSNATVNIVNSNFGAASVTLNRVVGPGTTQIFGHLNALGSVFLVNPGGVLFGTGSQLNVGSLVASTLDISNDNFNAGVGSGTFVFNNGSNATISNAGQISAGNKGLVAFLGGTTSNDGNINAPGGTIAMGGGFQVTLDIGGDGLTQLVIDQPYSYGNHVDNGGTLQADGGMITLTSNTLTFGTGTSVVNQHGIVRAHSLQSRGGVIELGNTANSVVEITGSNDASANDPNIVGGSIDVSGRRLMVYDNASFTAAGNGASNGTLTFDSLASIQVADAAQFTANQANDDGYSYLSDTTISGALNHATDVTLSARGLATAPLNNYDINSNALETYTGTVNFGQYYSGTEGNGQQLAPSIVKSAGPDASLTVNANRNIWMSEANISSSNGKLNVVFNADSSGTPADRGNGAVDSGGSIGLDDSTIVTNGGAIAFYGQSNPNGRATGSVIHYFDNATTISSNTHNTGIDLEATTLDACAQSGCAAGSGSINLRGQGTDSLANDGTLLLNGTGIGMYGSTLRAGGDIGLDGLGSTLGAGVYLDGIFFESENPPVPQVIDSQGNVSVHGVAGNESAKNTINIDGEEDGIDLGLATINAAGNVTMIGQGGTRNLPSNAFAFSSNGVDIFGDAHVTAGAGHTVGISGQAGSAGYGPYDAEVPATLPVYGVSFEPSAARIAAAGGSIDIRGLADSDVSLAGGTFDTSSLLGLGGNISVAGYNTLLGANTVFNADGIGGGTVAVSASNVLAMDPTANISASTSSGNGNGGTITLDGDQGLYAYGSLFARGGASGGNGGQIETSGSGLDLRGLKVNASSAHGAAGTWLIDPYNVTIVHGNAPGVLLANPFVPTTTTTIQDSDISYSLNQGSNVTITTGSTATGTDAGNIDFDQGVAIERNAGTAPLTFELDAHSKIASGIYENENISIIADPGTGPLNMLFDSDADQLLGFGNGGISLASLTLRSNGGNVEMYGQRNAATGYSGGIYLNGPILIDTRVNGSDTAAAGNVLLRGHGGGYTGTGSTGVILGFGDYNNPIVISTGTGNIDVVGVGDNGGDGIALATTNVGPLQLITSSGHIALTGFGSTYATPFGGSGNGNGISSSVYFNGNGGPFAGISLQTDSGTIDLRGFGPADSNLGNGTTLTHNGISLGAGTQLGSNSGSILLSGSSLGSGAGIDLIGGLAPNSTTSTLIDAGSGNIVLRAHNSQAARVNSLQIGDVLGVRTSGIIDIRPGSVDANGGLVENPTDQIVVGAGDTYNGGINLSVANLAQLQAGTLVLGSNLQSGNVTISQEAGDINYAGNLTLQASGGGSVQLNGGALDVGANTLALIAAGDISQTGAITAGSLLAQSSGGAVILANAGNNVSSNTLAGAASGNFTFINAGTVGIGNVNAVGFTAASNTASTLTSSGIAGSNVLVHALNGNMILGANVSGGNIDLVSNGIFDNTNGSTISATGNWQVWGNSWVGETRSGLAGNGNLPNLYGCAFNGACGVTPSATANQFIYIAQPTATVNFANSTREYGLPNATIGYTVGGLILGDQAANAINGTVDTDATQASNVGSYAIGGNFVSPAGYLVNVRPGALAITPATLTYTANPYSRIYGDPNDVLGGSLSGFRLSDTQASSTTGTLAFTSDAMQASNVGTYAINGGGLTATNYVFVQAADNTNAFAITPATLTYIADPYRRMVGVPNGQFGGSVSGFRNGDTLASSTDGTLLFQSSAGTNSPVGTYAINGNGLAATNYIFTQANGNAVALTIMPPLGTYTLDFVRETPVTYVYDRNFGIVGLCPATDLASGSRDKDGDTLAREWSRVRSRPNLANCVSTKQKNSCGDF
ncbi:MAG TPA: MBG domain-containing protein [Rhodanobacter sp.]